MASSSLLNIRSKITQDIINGGRAKLHSQYPDDFEYYACTLLLENGSGDTIEIFHFPVMPNSISSDKRPLVNIRKTARGYMDQFSNSFVGNEIKINGTFGKKFRLLLLNDNIKSLNKKSAEKLQIETFLKNSFNPKIKTGYGALKLMEKIIYMSTKLDGSGKPYKLFFFNYTLGEQFFVEPVGWSKQQSVDNNMMWDYSLQMKVIGNAKEKFKQTDKKKMSDTLKTSSIQSIFNDTVNNLTAGGITRSVGIG